MEYMKEDLQVGQTYETVGGLVFVVLSQCVRLNSDYRQWRVLPLIGRYGGPKAGVPFNLLEYSAYHQQARPL